MKDHRFKGSSIGDVTLSKRHPKPHTYICARCGCLFVHKKPGVPKYCPDCRGEIL